MATRMATPSLNPKTRVYYFRKAVPARLRDQINKSEVVRSLRTKDPAEAKIRFLAVAAEVEADWAARIPGKPRLNFEQISALAGEFYHWLMGKHLKNPGSAAKWQAEVDRERRRDARKGNVPALHALANISMYLREVEIFLKETKIVIDDNDLFPLAQAASITGQQAKEDLAKYVRNRSKPEAPDFPEWKPEEPALQSIGKPLTVEAHFEKFATDKVLGPGTRKRWKPLLEKLAAHVGSKDLSRVTKVQLVDWKDALLKEEIQLVTICDSHLSAARNLWNGPPLRPAL